VIEHTLGEGLARGGSAELGIETERLVDGEVGFDDEHGGSDDGGLGEDVASLSVEDGVDASHGVFWALDLDEVDRLEKSGLGGEHGGVENAASGGDDLSTSAVNGVGVQGDVVEIKADSAHVLVAQNSLLGSPVETGLDGILDFVEELDSLGDVDDHVGTGLVRSEAPDLSAVVDVPLVTGSFPWRTVMIGVPFRPAGSLTR